MHAEDGAAGAILVDEAGEEAAGHVGSKVIRFLI